MPSAQFYKLVHVWDDQAEYQNHLIKDDVKCYQFFRAFDVSRSLLYFVHEKNDFFSFVSDSSFKSTNIWILR